MVIKIYSLSAIRKSQPVRIVVRRIFETGSKPLSINFDFPRRHTQKKKISDESKPQGAYETDNASPLHIYTRKLGRYPGSSEEKLFRSPSAHGFAGNMSGLSRLILLAMLVALASANSKLMPYPGDCSTFYECASEKCPDGWTFDPTALKCLPSLVKVMMQVQPMEQTAIFPDDNDNTIYWTCTRMPCPIGLQFNPIKLVCEDPTVAGCKS
ncbi:hypothetical protein J437_LFUL009217 [Ladona fulva]|uniref:Chitin-binding type-2 domain-containing protein n=1 Tax=Ladona fulva TaxID=123851 RepID=A0A8K0P136_LADFU|nr:hypothetical protein J437_LFUL009217 [Ladona fulva]